MPLIPSSVIYVPCRFAAQFGSACIAAHLLHVSRFTLARLMRLIFLFPIKALPQVVVAKPCATYATWGKPASTQIRLEALCFLLTCLFEETSRCLVTQHCHIRGNLRRQIRRWERRSDSWPPGWVTVLRDPPRGIQPWVMIFGPAGRERLQTQDLCCPPTLSSVVPLSSVGDPWRPFPWTHHIATPSVAPPHLLFGGSYTRLTKEMKAGTGLTCKDM